MASGSVDALLAAVMKLRTAYIAEKQAKLPEGEAFDIEGDETIADVMSAVRDFHEHMRTR